MAEPSVSRNLRQTGFRMTRQRKLVADILATANDHPTVTEIHARARRSDPLIAMSTVYRILAALEDAGLVERRSFWPPAGGPPSAQYELADPEPHDHLIDVASGTVIDFQDDELDAIKRRIAERLGYRLVGCSLQIYAEPSKPGGRGQPSGQPSRARSDDR